MKRSITEHIIRFLFKRYYRDIMKGYTEDKLYGNPFGTAEDAVRCEAEEAFDGFKDILVEVMEDEIYRMMKVI